MMNKILLWFISLPKKNPILFGIIIASGLFSLGTVFEILEGNGFSRYSEIVFWSLTWGLLAFILSLLQKDRRDLLTKKDFCYQILFYFLWSFVLLILTRIITAHRSFYRDYMANIHQMLSTSIVGSIGYVIYRRYKKNKKGDEKKPQGKINSDVIKK